MIDSNYSGVEAFRFDLKEIEGLTRLPDHGGLTMVEAERHLGISKNVLLNLIAIGALSSQMSINPKKQMPPTDYPPVSNRRIQRAVYLPGKPRKRKRYSFAYHESSHCVRED